MRLFFISLVCSFMLFETAHASDIQRLESFYYEIDSIERLIFNDPVSGREELLKYESSLDLFPTEAALAYYNQLILSFAYSQEYAKAYEIACRIAEEYRNSNASKEYALLLLNKAYSSVTIDDASFEEVQYAYEYGMETNDAEVLLSANLTLGGYYSVRDNIIQAHEHILEAEKYARQLNTYEAKSGLATVYYMLATLNSQMERSDAVIDYGKKSASIFRELGDIASVSAANALSSYAMIQKEQYKEAQSEIEALIIDVSHQGMDYLIVSPTYLLALVHYKQGNYQDANSILERIREQVIDEGLLGNGLPYHNLKVRTLIKLGMKKEAQDYFKTYIMEPEALEQFDESDEILYGKVQSVKSYAMLLESQGELRRAIEYWRSFINLRVSHLRRKRSAAIQEYLVKHAVDVSNKQSEKLEKESQAKKLKLTEMKKELSNNELLMWFGVIIALLIAGIIFNQNVIRQRLKKIVDTDALTGVKNRRYLMDYGRRVFDKQETEVGSVILMDIDRFKLINDDYGHDAGDAVLATFAEIASQHVREGDTFGRYGGEEFVAILPKANKDEAEAIARRILSAICSYNWVEIKIDKDITASVGVSSKRHWDQDFSELLKEADTAMYAVKNNAKNDVKHFSDLEGI